MAVSANQGVVISTLKAEMESVSPEQFGSKPMTDISSRALWIQNWEATKWSEVDENGVSSPNSNCNHKYYSPSAGWSTWSNTGKAFCDTPVALKYGANNENVVVFGVGYDGLVWAGKLTSEYVRFLFQEIDVGETTKKIRPGSISATAYASYVEVVAVERSNSQLLIGWFAINTSISTWTTISTACYCLSNPVVISCKEGCLDVFVFADTMNLMRTCLRSGGYWTAWQNLVGIYIYHPAAISVSPGRLDVFGIGSDAQLYRNSSTITGNEVGTFTQTCLGGISIASPKIQIISPVVYAVITKKTKGVFQQKYLETSTGYKGMTSIMMGSKLFYAELGAELSSGAKMLKGASIAV
ncbi:hypothetical protein BTUL_0148g00140 [Botrytis tulipae]|uniref:PLL-like beta propeller domain-containing protein n=1 Tax=Botrytis tulipae TaxID=87230 RepID=A0A4Z1EES3_9HELO|nr:hypothetical protein BTUL_0148g00140 [Botrytis tulipae]